jgi:pyranose oxidase
MRKSPAVVEWSSAHTVFDLADRPTEQFPRQRFNLFSATMCEKLVLKAGSKSEIEYAIVRNFQDDTSYKVRAKIFILATGAVHNPQLLVASGFGKFGMTQSESRIPNLGHYITEQTMSFCQTVFSEQMVNKVIADMIIKGTPGKPDYSVEIKPDDQCVNPKWWNQKVQRHMMAHQEDPLPIPYDDPGTFDRQLPR